MKIISPAFLSTVFVLLIASVLTNCQSSTGNEEVIPEENITPPITNPSTNDADKISDNLIFNDSRLITAALPANANLADLKIDKDTINLWPGIKNRIRILNNGPEFISGIYVHIAGSENYHEVELESVESTDSISVFYIDIDPSGIIFPFDSNIVIAPYNSNGDVIDEFGRDIHGDPPFDGTGETPNTESPEYCKPAINKNLYWSYTSRNGEFVNGPGYIAPSAYEVGGCCYEGKSSSCLNINASVNVTNQWSKVKEEVFKFFSGDNSFVYVLSREFNDYDPKKTDFCASTPGYSLRSSGINTAGSYSMSPVNGFETFSKITIHDIDFDLDDALNIGYGPFTQPNTQNPNLEYYLGCNQYIEINNIEGSTYLRVFETTPGAYPPWLD